MINRRMYSKDEFRAKLRARGHSSAVIEETVQYIAELGYLSDRDYAEAYARQQARSSTALFDRLLKHTRRFCPRIPL